MKSTENIIIKKILLNKNSGGQIFYNMISRIYEVLDWFAFFLFKDTDKLIICNIEAKRFISPFFTS